MKQQHTSSSVAGLSASGVPVEIRVPVTTAGGRRRPGALREVYDDDDDGDPFRCRVAHRFV